MNASRILVFHPYSENTQKGYGDLNVEFLQILSYYNKNCKIVIC